MSNHARGAGGRAPLEGWFGGVILGLALFAMPWTARAQSEMDSALRRDLLAQAQQARVAGDHARALDLAERAGRIGMTPSVRMFIAEEQFALGRLAEAFANGDSCAREAERDTSLRSRDAILSTCRALAERVRPRLGRVNVTLPSPLPGGFVLTIAGHPVNPAFYGLPYPVTPGGVEIVATAGGRADFHVQVSVSMGQTADVRVLMPPATTTNESHVTATQSAASTSATTSTPSPAPSAHATSSTTPEPRSTPPLVGPLVVAAVGVAGFIGAGVFAALRSSAQNTLSSSCDLPDSTGLLHCDDTSAAHGAYQSVQTDSYAVDVGLAVGVVGVAAAATWFIIGRVHRPAADRAITLMPLPGGASISFGGRL